MIHVEFQYMRPGASRGVLKYLEHPWSLTSYLFKWIVDGSLNTPFRGPYFPVPPNIFQIETAEVDMAQKKKNPSTNKNTKKQLIIPSRFTRITHLLIRVVNWDEMPHHAYFQPAWLSCLEAP